jgi:hypothetical protein
MASSFIPFVDRLIYATAAEAVITPNHRNWLKMPHNGEDWINHYVDNNPNSMLAAFEAWLQANNLPPLILWDGVNWAQYAPTDDLNQGISTPLPAGLDGSFAGITTLEQLGLTFKSHYDNVVPSFNSTEPIKAPYSYRFWSLLKWANILLRRFRGEIVVPPGVIYDRDGTILSAFPFLSVVNEVHWHWHDNDGPHGLHLHAPGSPLVSPLGTTDTPGYSSTVGQRVSAKYGSDHNRIGDEFFRFHRDHIAMFSNWLARQGQPPPRTINMINGLPQAAEEDNNPSTWTEPSVDIWINAEGGDMDEQLKGVTSLNDMGHDVMSAHAAGHNNNGDIRSGTQNNFSVRFFAWHTWVDSQWWWREPHFAQWNPATGLRDRTFKPVLFVGGADWPGMQTLTVIRDLNAAADEVTPVGSLSGLDLTTGAGTLRMKFFVKDPYNRNLTLTLTAEVFNDSVSTTGVVESVVHTSAVGVGGDFALDNSFTVDFGFPTAFRSDDPNRAQPAVGFVNSRVRIGGSLRVADNSDSGFIHQDFTEILLLQEKEGPDVTMYFNQSSFGDNQVETNMSGGESRFTDALIIVVQDRTSRPAPISWPPKVADELKGILQGLTPASGLFKDAVHSPQVSVDSSFEGVSIVPNAAGPTLEDTSLADSLPQRFTYHYDVVFQSNNNAFDGLPADGSQSATLNIVAADRSGNRTSSSAMIRFLKSANPYMVDGSPPWLSIDTRVFHMFQDENFQGETLAVNSPGLFIRNVLQNLNNVSIPQATRDSWFDSLPVDADQSVLEYSTSITNRATNVARKVYNFALAKVRLRGTNGAANIRAFFRLFRYSATNLIFDADQGYRVFSAGGSPDVKVPLLGFSSGGDVTSIPFFAEDRVSPPASMTIQRDDPNVRSFIAGPSNERVLYFGAFLDINQDAAQLPSTRINFHPDGPFMPAETQPIRSLIFDAHCCMVTEIKFDGNPTLLGETPFTSSNLAQRNLAIVQTDNPGSLITHTVEHSFEVDLGRPFLREQNLTLEQEVTSQQPLAIPGSDPDSIHFTTTSKLELMVRQQAQELAFGDLWMSMGREEGEAEKIVEKYLPLARRIVQQRNPFVFDPVEWRGTTSVIDEIIIQWNRLPTKSNVELYLPGISCENVLNLRALRHAPRDVKIIDSHRLRLTPGGTTYIPLPPTRDRRVVGTIKIELPGNIEQGQKWRVDVFQLQGYYRQITGAFQLNIQVSKAAAIADREVRLLEALHERLVLTPRASLWYPVLQRRVDTVRARAKGLSDAAGFPFNDPTVWTNPSGNQHPLRGQRIRVILEKIEVNKCGRARSSPPYTPHLLRITTRIRTEDNGITEQRHALPEHAPGFKLNGTATTDVVHIGTEIFRGWVEDDLAVEISAAEVRAYEGEALCKYKRVFSGPVESFLRNYRPNDEPIDPEVMGSWEVWYRVERT